MRRQSIGWQFRKGRFVGVSPASPRRILPLVLPVCFRSRAGLVRVQTNPLFCLVSPEGFEPSTY